MKSRYLTAITAAALLGTAPAWAQFTDSAKTSTANPTTNATKPLCSELGHPQAGKLAGKDTGSAKDNSSSPVHTDCIPDSQASARGTNAANAAIGNSASSPSSTASGSATASPSATGSSAGVNSAVTGSSTDTSTSVTGSTSTFSPNIDLRGRSTLSIDNATTTGSQSVDTTSAATTGSQSSSGNAAATTGSQSATGSAAQSSDSAVTTDQRKRRESR